MDAFSMPLLLDQPGLTALDEFLSGSSPLILQTSDSSSPSSQQSESLAIDPSLLLIETTSHISSNDPISSSSAVAKRRPIPRKGHTKSRRGCFNCKRRKIKCQENLPRCEHCRKLNLPCEYPAQAMTMATVSPTIQPQATPTVFSMKDMQFFHHFLVKAYPHLPVEADAVWTLSVPAIAHQYGYLIHAMLGLGASSLANTASDPSEFRPSALAHRVEAVKLLNQALSTPATDRRELDARFATLMVLTFQSTAMAEGMTDFLTMLRGCVLESANADETSCFWSFMQTQHLNTMDRRFDETQLRALDGETLDQATTSLAALKPYCRPGVELQYHSLLEKLIKVAYVSPRNAYYDLTTLYNIVGFMSSQDFQYLVDKSNAIAQILLGHFLAMQKITKPLTEVEAPRRYENPLFDMLQSWICRIHTHLDPSVRHLNEWPLSFINQSPWVNGSFRENLMPQSIRLLTE